MGPAVFSSRSALYVISLVIRRRWRTQKEKQLTTLTDQLNTTVVVRFVTKITLKGFRRIKNYRFEK